MKNYDNASGMIATATATYASITDISNVLNIILLIISIANILLVVIFKIYDRLKDGNLTKEEREDTIKDVEDAKREIGILIDKKGKDDNNEQIR